VCVGRVGGWVVGWVGGMMTGVTADPIRAGSYDSYPLANLSGFVIKFWRPRKNGSPFSPVKLGLPSYEYKPRAGVPQAAFQHFSTCMRKYEMEQTSSCQHGQSLTWKAKPQNKDDLPAMSLIDTSAMDADGYTKWVCPECERNQHTS